MKGETWTFGATVPANTTATFLLPAEGGTFTVNGKEESALKNCDGIVCLGRENGAVRLEASCGVFRFVRRAQLASSRTDGGKRNCRGGADDDSFGEFARKISTGGGFVAGARLGATYAL